MEIMDFKFWKGKKVLITGHTGFKGSWLVLILRKLEAICYCYSLKPEPNCQGQQKDVDADQQQTAGERRQLNKRL